MGQIIHGHAKWWVNFEKRWVIDNQKYISSQLSPAFFFPHLHCTHTEHVLEARSINAHPRQPFLVLSCVATCALVWFESTDSRRIETSWRFLWCTRLAHTHWLLCIILIKYARACWQSEALPRWSRPQIKGPIIVSEILFWAESQSQMDQLRWILVWCCIIVRR